MDPISLAQRRKAVGFLLLATLCGAMGFPLVKALVLVQDQILPRSGGWFATALAVGPRFLLPIPLLLWWQYRQGQNRKITRQEWKQGLQIGFFAATGVIVLTDGLRFASASTGAFFASLYAIMVPTWLALRHRKVHGPVIWLSCFLVLIGVAILGRFDWHDFKLGRGELETLATAVFFTGQLLYQDDRRYTGNRPVTVTLITFIVTMGFFVVLAAATAPNLMALVLPWTSTAWLGLTVALALIPSLASYVLVIAWQPKITATEAGLIFSVEPILSFLSALFLPGLFSTWMGIHYLNEHSSFHLLVGGGLITLANILVQLRPP